MLLLDAFYGATTTANLPPPVLVYRSVNLLRGSNNRRGKLCAVSAVTISGQIANTAKAHTEAKC